MAPKRPVVLVLSAALLALAFAAPGSAADKKSFEGTLVHPGADVSLTVGEELACPDGGPLNNQSYAFIDLGKDGQFKKFELTGPAYLFSVPDPTGVLGGLLLADHDLDLYLFDAKCTEIHTHTNDPSSTVKTETKKPARYALVNYYTGIHPDLAFNLVAS